MGIVRSRARRMYRWLIVLALLALYSPPAKTYAKEEIQGAMSPAWAPDGSRIAYVIASEQHQALYIIEEDGSAPVKLTDNAIDPKWSPDGKKISYTDYSGAGGVVYTINADGSGRTKVGIGCCSGWSPDGRQITFVRSDLQLWIANGDGSMAHSLIGNSSLQMMQHWWSPDGKRIAFSAPGKAQAAAQLYLINVDGSNLRKLTDSDEAWLSWSSDGKQAVLIGNCGGLNNHDLCIMDADSSSLRRLTDYHGHLPVWSPDGTRIAHVVGGSLCLVDVNSSSQHCPAALNQIETSYRGSAPIWSPDGKHIAFVPDHILCLVDIDSSSQYCLSEQLSFDWLPPSPWSRDGKRLLVQRNHLRRPIAVYPDVSYTEVYVIHADGSNLRRLPDGFEIL